MSTRTQSGDWPSRALAAISAIRQDLPADVVRYMSRPITARTVNEHFSELAAQVDALARIVGDLIERTEADR